MRYRVIVLAGLLLSGCYAAPSDSPVDNFEYVWKTLDQMYGGFGIRQVDWDASYTRWRPTIDEASSDTELFGAITGMLGELDDGHVQLAAPVHELWSANAFRREKREDDSFDIELVKEHYLTELEIGPSDSYVRGALSSGVEYVWFPWIDDNTYAIDSIVDSGPSTIVVDLRHNGGGAYTYALDAFGRLTSQDIDVFHSRTRNGPDHDDFGDWWTTQMVSRGETFDGQLIVLTDGWTISAGERLVMALQAIPGSITVGTPTNGSQATSVGGEMPNGWNFSLPVQEVEHVDRSVTEGVGIPVDVEVLNDPAVMATGVDEMLDAAIEAAKTSR